MRNLDVNCLHQDRTGVLWVCTEFGLYRYDGSRFELATTVEGSSLPLIQGIVEDSLGRLWLSTPERLIYRESAEVHSVAPANQNLSIDLRSALVASPKDPSQVFFISHHVLMSARTMNSGRSWAIGQVFKGEALSRFPMLANIKGAYADPEGAFWLGCGEQICEWKEGEIKLFGPSEGVPSEPWSAMIADRHGNLWARGSHHVVRLKARAAQFDVQDKNLPASILEIRSPCLLEDPQGRMLANTANGIARWDQGSWVLFTERNGLPTGLIQAMAFDRQGSLWFDGGRAGIQRWLGYDSWASWTTDNGLSTPMVWTVLRDAKKDLWVGTELDLEVFAANRETDGPRRVPGNLHVRRVQSLAMTADKHLWIGSDDGTIVEYDPAHGTSRLISQERSVYQVFVDREDRVWVLAASGLFLVERHGRTAELHPPPGSAVPAVPFYRAVQATTGQDDTGQAAPGDIFFMSNQGLYRLRQSAWSRIQLPPSFRAGYNSQIALGKDGTFWLSGTVPALMQFRLNGDSAIELSEVSPPTLGSGNVYLLASDQRGWLWVGTDSGIDVFNGSEWRHLGQDDGLVWDDINTGAFFADDDGSVWIGTGGGLSHLLDPARLFVKDPLQVTLSQAKLGDKVLDPGTQSEVRWGHYPLTFHMASLDFARAHAISYRYRLSGVDDAPQQTADHEVRYPFVPDGYHRLVVTAVDPGTHRVSSEAVLEFTIHPPWWRTPWFFSVVALATILFTIYAWRWSNRYATARRLVLQELVRERTHELEQKNASLLDARAALLHQAMRDSLTGVLNRGAIYAVLEKEIERGHREEESLIVVLADVDHFKRVNDLYGHQCGDHVLQEVTRRLASAIRPYDSFGRYGGEEFLIVFPNLSSDESRSRIEGLRQIIEANPVTCDEVSLQITCSFGVAAMGEASDLKALVHAADLALYTAKANGRNRVEFAEANSRRSATKVLSHSISV